MLPPKYISLDELKGIVRARLTEAPSLRKLAPTLDMSATALSYLLTHARAMPGPRLLKKLGYREERVYVRVKP